MARKKKSKKDAPFMKAGKWTQGRVPNPIPARGIFVNPSTPRDVNAFREDSKAPLHLAAAHDRWADFYDERGRKGDKKKAKQAEKVSKKARALAKEIKAMEKLHGRNKNPHDDGDMHMRMANPRRRKRRKRKSRKKNPGMKAHAQRKSNPKRRKRRKNPVGRYVYAKRKSNPAKGFGKTLANIAMKFTTMLIAYAVPGMIDALVGERLANTEMYKKTKNPRAWAGATIGAGSLVVGGLLTSYVKPLKSFRETAVPAMLLYTAQNVIAGFVGNEQGGGYDFLRSAMNLKQPGTYGLIERTMPKIMLVVVKGGSYFDSKLNEVAPKALADGTLTDAKTGRILVNAETGARLVAAKTTTAGTVYHGGSNHAMAGHSQMHGYANLVPTASGQGAVSGYVNLVDPNIPADTPDYLLYQQKVSAAAPAKSVVAGHGNPMRRHGKKDIFRNAR